MRSHIPALDGLRAIAVLLVIATHTAHPLLGIGWVGVDVFFVLSGFLISRLLLTEIQETGTIRLGPFYGRRAARLYPALLLTLMLVALLALTDLNESSEITALRAVIAGVYLSDLWVWGGGDLGPLTHTWSLAVEEQFYLLWPLLLLVQRTRARAGLVIAAGAASLAAMLWPHWPTGQIDHSAVYFAPWARAWELLLGCGLAMSWPTVERAARPWAAWAGCAAAAAVLATAPLFPVASAWQALLVGVSTVAVIWASGTRSLPVRVLAARPLRWIGDRSYGLYLYHYPAFWVAGQFALRRSMVAVVAMAIALPVAYLSYRFVEVPIRRSVRSAFDQRRMSKVHGAGDDTAVHVRDLVTEHREPANVHPLLRRE